MSYIKWELDTEDELDAYDPLGRISILGDEGKIEEECTYIDAFFEAIIDGVQRMEIGKIIRVDPLIEPDDIVFRYTSEELFISYGNSSTTILDVIKFLDDLRNTIESLVIVFDKLTLQKGQKPRELIYLREFLAK
jgi:hypothetical protein